MKTEPVIVAFMPRLTPLNVPDDHVRAEPLDEVMDPPLSAREAELPSVAVPPPAASELALSTRPSVPEVEEIPAFILMLLCADSVNVAFPPAVLLMALLSVMSPFWAPPALVVIVTLIPALSAAWIVPMVMMAESAMVVKLGLPETLVSDPAL